jgi:hypothetical protein
MEDAKEQNTDNSVSGTAIHLSAGSRRGLRHTRDTSGPETLPANVEYLDHQWHDLVHGTLRARSRAKREYLDDRSHDVVRGPGSRRQTHRPLTSLNEMPGAPPTPGPSNAEAIGRDCAVSGLSRKRPLLGSRIIRNAVPKLRGSCPAATGPQCTRLGPASHCPLTNSPSILALPSTSAQTGSSTLFFPHSNRTEGLILTHPRRMPSFQQSVTSTVSFREPPTTKVVR